MATVKLLNNLPVKELTQETDYLGLIDKGDIIKTFLVSNKDQFNEIKMFCLYGEWGSGKSSLMKYLQKELNEDFNTFFFEAWEFEKDENLAMSLLEFITTKHIGTGEAICNDILKYGGRILRGLGKSVKLNVPLYPNGAGIELSPSAFIDEMEKQEELTFYKALEKFKTEFKRLEDKIKVTTKKEYNIVFIDDLDRCEPEQVLNLLSAIKLFFTYGQKTIFFCGIDKKAVEEAVKTKYGEIVKSNEYLEKIFDISFTMPNYDSIEKLIRIYFEDTQYSAAENKPISEVIDNFLKALEFRNPRRVKKVLNKFQIVRSLKQNWKNRDEVFPNIDEGNGEEKSLFETLLVLYLIILYEFYPDLFADFLNFDKKKDQFYKYHTLQKTNNRNTIFYKYADEIDKYDCSDLKISELYTYFNNYKNNSGKTDGLAITLFPTFVNNILLWSAGEPRHIPLHDRKLLVDIVQIDYLFYNFIIDKKLQLKKSKNSSQSTLRGIKELIGNML